LKGWFMTSDINKGTSERPRSSRWLRFALFASLALNALFVGGLISAFVRHGGPLLMASAAAPNNLGAFIGTLPQERRGAVWKATAEKRRTMMPLRRDVRIARRDMLASLTAEPFDGGAFAAAQTRLIEAEHRQRLAQRDFLVDVAGVLSPSERQAYIKWRGPMRSPQPGEDDEPQQPRK
jgi:uncharacterized membrane protein